MRARPAGSRTTGPDPRPPTRIALLAHSALLTLSGLLVTAAGGCATGPAKVSTSAAPPPAETAAADRAAADPAPGTGTGTERGEDLRAQADIDVAAIEAILKRSAAEAEAAGAEAESGSARATGAPGAAATDETPPPAAPPGSIRWNTPDGAVAPGPAPAEVTAGPDALAREEPTLAPVSPAAAGPALSREERRALDDLGLQLVRLRQELYRESIDSDQPVRELLGIAAMSMIDPDLELPSGIERDLSPEEVELLERLHHFFAAIGRRLGGGDGARATVVEALRELQVAIEKKPVLLMPATALCWRIEGFGDYDAFDKYVYLAHSEQQVILYLEIDGFASEQNRKSEWVTEISQQLEIYSDRDGIPVWSEPWQKAVDVTVNRRRDFFTTQLITLPEALSVGKYHLKIRVRDEHSGAEAEESITFEMVADPKMAARVGGSEH